MVKTRANYLNPEENDADFNFYVFYIAKSVRTPLLVLPLNLGKTYYVIQASSSAIACWVWFSQSVR